MKRILFILALAAAIAAPARAAEGEWQPDQALIAKIEAAFAPMMAAGLTDIGDHPVKALGPLAEYARFYAGETVKGEKVVVGGLLHGISDKPPGIYVVPMSGLPQVSGGGCGVVMLWYHVDSGKVESVCNFPM